MHSIEMCIPHLLYLGSNGRLSGRKSNEHTIADVIIYLFGKIQIIQTHICISYTNGGEYIARVTLSGDSMVLTLHLSQSSNSTCDQTNCLVNGFGIWRSPTCGNGHGAFPIQIRIQGYWPGFIVLKNWPGLIVLIGAGGMGLGAGSRGW